MCCATQQHWLLGIENVVLCFNCKAVPAVNNGKKRLREKYYLYLKDPAWLTTLLIVSSTESQHVTPSRQQCKQKRSQVMIVWYVKLCCTLHKQ